MADSARTAARPAARSNGAPLATSVPETSPERLTSLFDAQREHHPVVRRTDADERRAKIRRLREGVVARRQEIRDALHADFRKAPEEVDLTEVKAVSDEAHFAEKNLDDWMAPDRASTPPLLMGTTSEVRYEPKGVSLIISPWNYPFNLTLGPLIAAIAAGNSVVIKPSEYTPSSTRVMKSLLDEIYDPREIVLVEGGVDTSQALLDLPFDHFYFTGSPQVGKIVMKAAAEHLSSVTLELGGKSPTIVDATADVDDAAAKIAWGKFTNTGQTCIAPDYVYVQASQHDAFVDRLSHWIHTYYGDTPADRQATGDYARMVNDKHFARVQRLLSQSVKAGARVAEGGQTDAADRYIAPTVLTNVPEDADVMQEEIFGPVLPVLPFHAIDDALASINRRPNPLALYLFTDRDETVEEVLGRTRAGGTCVNDVLLHYMNPHIPFGGAGHSGIGKGHGRYAFEEFSHARSVVRRTYGSKLMRNAYPPYGPLSRRIVDWLLKYF